MVGISRQRVNELLKTDPEFPVLEAGLAAGRIWSRSSIESWMAARSRPRKEASVREINGVALVPPQEISDAALVGDRFRSSKPVVVDLRGLDQILVRRSFDFSAGLTYGLKGLLDRLIEQVLLLQPIGHPVDRTSNEGIVDQLCPKRRSTTIRDRRLRLCSTPSSCGTPWCATACRSTRSRNRDARSSASKVTRRLSGRPARVLTDPRQRRDQRSGDARPTIW
jgi:Cell division protein SepF